MLTGQRAFQRTVKEAKVYADKVSVSVDPAAYLAAVEDARAGAADIGPREAQAEGALMVALDPTELEDQRHEPRRIPGSE